MIFTRLLPAAMLCVTSKGSRATAFTFLLTSKGPRATAFTFLLTSKDPQATAFTFLLTSKRGGVDILRFPVTFSMTQWAMNRAENVAIN